LDNKDKNHLYRKCDSYNAYEDLVTGKAKNMETKTFNRINGVLNNPSCFMPDKAINPAMIETTNRCRVNKCQLSDFRPRISN